MAVSINVSVVSDHPARRMCAANTIEIATWVWIGDGYPLPLCSGVVWATENAQMWSRSQRNLVGSPWF